MIVNDLHVKIPPEVIEKIAFYVYKLIDPRNGKVFYIGKGFGERVLAHVREEADLSDDEGEILLSPKLETIRAIKNAGLDPIHIIVRHGLDSDSAHLIESVLIQETAGLTNLVAGYGAESYGSATLKQLINRYAAPEMELKLEEKIIAINISASKEDRSIYEAVRFAWVINPLRAKEADFVLAVTDGICIGVFKAKEWLPATTTNFPLLSQNMPKRYGFVGEPVTAGISERFLNKRLPESLQRKRGESNPIRYSYD
jgi:hypothetical protein